MSQPGAPNRAPRICFVTSELDGGADAHPPSWAPLLERGGWDVHFLAVADLPLPAWHGIPSHGDGSHGLVDSQRTMDALLALQAETRFDLIEFPDRGALGFRATQAKRSGLGFDGVALAVRLRSPSELHRRRDREALRSPWELKAEWCERYAFERADMQIAVSPDVVRAAREIGWPVRDDVVLAPPAAAEGADRVVESYRGAAARARREAAGTGRASDPKPPTVSVAVAHRDHGAFLPSALASLAAQESPPDEVLAVDDGSTDPEALSVFERMERKYPEWTFLRQENAGPGAARNRCLELARGDCFLPFDSDNIARPDLVGTLRRAMSLDPGLAVATCETLAIVEDEDIEKGRFAFRYAPTGGPRLLSCVENVFGDACALFRADALRAVGGFETVAWSPYEDWETMIKLAFGGYAIDVVPRPLFWYRTGVGGRLETLSGDPAAALRLRRRLIEDFLADADLDRAERVALWECFLAAADPGASRAG